MIRLVPVILSLIVLAAHFMRGGSLILVASVLFCAGLLVLQRGWVPRVVQVVLALGALEWVRTLVTLATQRARLEQPFARMAAILLVVALITGLSALLLRGEWARERYGASEDDEDPEDSEAP